MGIRKSFLKYTKCQEKIRQLKKRYTIEIQWRKPGTKLPQRSLSIKSKVKQSYKNLIGKSRNRIYRNHHVTKTFQQNKQTIFWKIRKLTGSCRRVRLQKKNQLHYNCHYHYHARQVNRYLRQYSKNNIVIRKDEKKGTSVPVSKGKAIEGLYKSSTAKANLKFSNDRSSTKVVEDTKLNSPTKEDSIRCCYSQIYYNHLYLIDTLPARIQKKKKVVQKSSYSNTLAAVAARTNANCSFTLFNRLYINICSFVFLLVCMEIETFSLLVELIKISATSLVRALTLSSPPSVLSLKTSDNMSSRALNIPSISKRKRCTSKNLYAMCALNTKKVKHLSRSILLKRNRFYSAWQTILLLCCISVISSVSFVDCAMINRSPSESGNRDSATVETPYIAYHLDIDEVADILDLTNSEADEVASNEQQLLELYERAQHLKHHHHQVKMRQQENLEQKQFRHHVNFDMNFDDLMPSLADVVSTLSPNSLHTKRKATKRAAPTTEAASGGLGFTTALPQTKTLPIPLGNYKQNINDTTSTNSDIAHHKKSSPAANPTPKSPVQTIEKCEPKIMDEPPPHPIFDDFTEISEDAARQVIEFLTTKFPVNNPSQILSEEVLNEIRLRVNSIASYALNEYTNLLAFAIAAPSIHTVVVKFRDNVTIPPEQVHNKAFLGSYWRELGYAWNSTDDSQKWGVPFRDCNLLVGRWLWPFRMAFNDYKIKVIIAAFTAADEDPCNDALEEVFGRRHGCDRNTTFCFLTGEKPSESSHVYDCICQMGYYLPNSSLQSFPGEVVEMSEGYDNYSCLPCPTTEIDGTCSMGPPQETVSLETLLKIIVGTSLGACILCCLVLSVIVFRQRKCKAIATGMWTVLETVLLGIVLLYASVTVHFFPASTERCLMEPWLRELGFITCYGAIILKLYRHLVDFRTRKAHRWVLRDVDLLKYLSVMIFAVSCYMAAFTASSFDLLETAKLESLREQRTNTCQPLKWDYVTQCSEIFILCFGLQLAIASRNANTQFRERQFLVATLVIEFIVSTIFYVLRFIYLQDMSPGAIFLALFLRSQLTNTLSLGLIFVPKLWYQHKQVSSKIKLNTQN